MNYYKNWSCLIYRINIPYLNILDLVMYLNNIFIDRISRLKIPCQT